jgi:hypothetical protein
MLGHLVFNGHAASPDAATRPVSGRPAIVAGAARHPGWLSRLIAQLLHRR